MTSGGLASPLRAPSLAAALGALVALVGMVIGTAPLSDNSFFTHLATGRLILDRGGVPTVDPYTFTALGEPWTVQSWLPSWLYASTEALGGAIGLRWLVGGISTLLALLAWRLLRPAASPLVRLALAGLFLAVGGDLWSARPLLVGLCALAVTILVVEGGARPWVLLPIGWIWANSHGSFPLGLVYLVVVVVGARLDGGSLREPLHASGWLTGGLAAGTVGPLGLGALTFPLELLGRQDVLDHVVEWQAPTFASLGERAFLLQLMLAVVALARRPTYRMGLVTAVFGGAALLGQRNIVIASLVLLPELARAAPVVGRLRSEGHQRAAAGLLLLAVTLGAVALAERRAQPNFELAAYPVDALAFIESQDLDLERHHLAAPDVVGNLRELIEGPSGTVFFDDRFDLFDASVSADHLVLTQLGTTTRSVLDAYKIDLALWPRGSPVAQWLLADDGWRPLYADDAWVLSCRRQRTASHAAAWC